MKVAIIYHSESGNTRRMAELVKEGAESVAGVEAKVMPLDDVDKDFADAAPVILLGSPTYEGTTSWQMKKFLDTTDVALAGKLGGVFVSQNWPGGGGGSFAEMSIIAGMLVRGMLIYSGGITRGEPYLHFGAVSQRSPEGLYAERCRKLGQNLATMGKKLFPDS